MDSNTGSPTIAPFSEALFRLQPLNLMDLLRGASLILSLLLKLPDVNASQSCIAIESCSVVADARAWSFVRIALRSADPQTAISRLQFEQARALVKAALADSFAIASASRADVRAALGVAPHSLPLVVSNFVATAEPARWARPISYQAILDRQLAHTDPSLVAFRLLSAPAIQARPQARLFKFALLALGLGLASPVLAAAREETCSRSLTRANDIDPTDQPTMDFAQVTSPTQRDQIVNLDDSALSSNKFLCISPALEAPYAAYYLPLPPRLG